jgi:phospholipid/cholesterol/gamma-HCH transport system substrate-binding protein
VAKLNKAVAERHVALADVIHNFGELTTELGRHDAEIKRFVTFSDAALGDFANQQQAIQESLREFPAALRAGNEGLASSKRFSDIAEPALTGLIPQAQALTPALKATGRMFSETTAPIRDQIRPFTREIRPVLTHANEGSGPLKKTVTGFGNAVGAFNTFFNELSYKPKGSRESVLFYLPWLNHNFNASFNLQDAGGPMLRGLVLISCTGADLGYQLAGAKPFIKTLLETTNVPRKEEIPVPSDPTGKCVYDPK